MGYSETVTGWTHIGGDPKIYPPIWRVTNASPIAPLVEHLTCKHENTALAVKPSVFMVILHRDLGRVCLGHSQKFIIAIHRLLLRRG